MARATATSGGAVLFAGSTVVIALLSLYFGGIPIVRALGYSAAIVVAVAVVRGADAAARDPRAARRADQQRCRLPVGGHHHDDQPARLGALGARDRHAARRSPRSPGRAILVALAIPLLDITLGQPDNSQLPTDTETRQSYDILDRGLRRRDQRAAAGLGQARPAGEAEHEEAEPGRGQAEEAGAAGAAAVRGAGAAGASSPASRRRPSRPGPTKKQQKQQEQQKKFLKSTASDPRLVKLGNQIAQGPRRRLRLAAGGQLRRGRRRSSASPRTPRRSRSAPSTSSTDSATRPFPTRSASAADDRVRRRLDRRLHRPRRPDRREAAAGDRDRRRRSASCC